MEHGGARPGAGRKPGAVNKRSIGRAERMVMKRGISPIVAAQKMLWRLYFEHIASGDQKLAKLYFDGLAVLSPYIASKLSPQDRTVKLALDETAPAVDRANAIHAAVARGEITPAESQRLMATLADHAKVVEISQLQQELAELRQTIASNSADVRSALSLVK